MSFGKGPAGKDGAADVHRYDDIIGLPHHRSSVRPHMSAHDRAAQFSPFAALSGFGEVIAETARVTEEETEPDESGKAILDAQLRVLLAHREEHPEAELLCFLPDGQKEGGRFAVLRGVVCGVDPNLGVILLEDGTRLPISRLRRIESDALPPFEYAKDGSF